MKYPVGIQDFRKLRQEGYVYIDKTQQICYILKASSPITSCRGLGVLAKA